MNLLYLVHDTKRNLFADIRTEDSDLPSDNDQPQGNELNPVSTHPSGEPKPRKDSSKMALPSIFLSSSNSTNQVKKHLLKKKNTKSIKKKGKKGQNYIYHPLFYPLIDG